MSQTKAQLVGGVGISTVGDLSVYGGVNATGVITATSFVGPLTGTATGLTGTPNVTVGVVTATSVSVSGNVSIAGTLTYEDVTNVDSIGIVTARSGVKLTGGDVTLGTGVTISGSTSNVFTLSTNGSERVRVDSSGRLAIGTTSPTFAAGGGVQASFATFSSFRATSGSNTGTDFAAASDGKGYIYVRDNADLLIGTNNAERGRFDASGRFLVGTSSDVSNGLSYTTTQIINSAWGTLSLGTSATGIANDTNIGEIRFYGNSGNTAAYGQFAKIACVADGTASSNADNPGRLVFSTTADGASSPTERCRISNSGGFSVGTTANPGAGAIYATGDITAFYSSDIRLKKDIEPISEPIKKLMEISGVTYKWNEEYLKDKDVDGYFVRETEVGVIAQEVEKVLPEVVATRENGYKAVRYEKLVALLIEAVKDQQHQIDELKARLEEK